MKKSDSERILELTAGGLTVFKHYIGERCLSKMFCNPLRKDTHPSCRLYENKGDDGVTRCYMKDFARKEYSGDCFWYVAKLTNKNLRTDFKSILETIDRDLCLGIFEDTPNATNMAMDNARKAQAAYRKASTSSIASFEVKAKSFSETEKSYWGQYGIREDTLDRYHVYSVESCNFRKKDGKSFTIFGSDLMPVFGYSFSQGKGFKFYRPKSKNRFLYAGKLPYPYIFGWEQLPAAGEIIYITGGEKDVMSLAAHGFNAIAFNSETAKVDKSRMSELSRRFKRIVFLYDADETGVNESKRCCAEFCNEFNVSRLQLPLSGTKKEKDISDYFKMGHSSQEFVLLSEEKTEMMPPEPK